MIRPPMLTLDFDELIVDSFAGGGGASQGICEALGKPLTKTAQVRMCGNSVCPPLARAIILAQFMGDAAEVAA